MKNQNAIKGLLMLVVGFFAFQSCVPNQGGGTPSYSPNITDRIQKDTIHYNSSEYIGTDTLKIDVDQNGSTDIQIYSANYQLALTPPLSEPIELWVAEFLNSFQGCMLIAKWPDDSYYAKHHVIGNSVKDSIGGTYVGKIISENEDNRVYSTGAFTSTDDNVYRFYWYQATKSNVANYIPNNDAHNTKNFILKASMYGRSIQQYPTQHSFGYLPFRFLKSGESDYRYGYVKLNYIISDEININDHWMSTSVVAYGLPGVTIRSGAI